MGRSARVPFRIRAKRDDIPGRVHEAESFFVESLEEWRERAGLEKMTLIGHSLGAYFSTVYALRYPERVHKLLLLSPAGVPQDPNNTVPSREMLDRQVTGEDGPVAADSERLAALEQEQRAEKKKGGFRTQAIYTFVGGGLEPLPSGAFQFILGSDASGQVLFSPLWRLERGRNARHA